MLKNIQNHSLEVPEMALLIKDHKDYNMDSNAPVPSRPVVSGNRGVNTHLSELLSEILEPLIPEMGGGEVASTEEALNAITDVNEKLTSCNNNWDKLNILEDLSGVSEKRLSACGEEITAPSCILINSAAGMDGMNKPGDIESPSRLHCNGPVGMDGMNKPI